MNLRTAVLIAVLAVAAAASWYLTRQNRGTAAPQPQNIVNRGYYLKSARILGTGPDGSLLYEIRADRAEQKEDDSIEFTDVSVRYSPQSDVPWTVIADTATIGQDHQHVILQGNVLAVSSEGFSGDQTEIATQHLELDPETYVAETDDRVHIRIGSRSLSATGMLASLKENRLQLRSNVSGKFVR
jgi:lipopolysaccharide export system protein LptC